MRLFSQIKSDQWRSQRRSQGERLLRGHLSASVAVSVLQWAFQYYFFTSSQVLNQAFFLSLFSVVSLKMFLDFYRWPGFLLESNNLLFMMLLQFLCFEGMALEYGHTAPLYLSVPPVMAALFCLQGNGHLSNRRRQQHSLVLLASTFVINFSVFFLLKREAKELAYFATYYIWFAGLFYGVFHYWSWSFLKDQTKKILSGDVKADSENHTVDNEKRDRLFFHDMINSTHGMALNLQYKLYQNKGLGPDGLKELLNEVNHLELLLKDHFGYGHRNLDNHQMVISFHKIKSSINQLIATYLPSEFFHCQINFEGGLKGDEFSDPCPVHFASFYRIVGNLVKNIAERKTQQVGIIFDYRDDGLWMTFTNQIYNLDRKSGELAHELGKIILKEDQESSLYKGLGLESIASLCTEQNGRFEFGIENGHWVSLIFLPRPSCQNLSIAS
jgi:hypothetical protein